jgi:putative ABC transport system substrate-binding protein
MRRRDLIIAVGGVALLPRVTRAQQASMPVIGFLSGASADAWAPLVVAFRLGLDETGYVGGKNVALEFRWADYRYERLPDLAADLVRRQVAVIVAAGGPPSIRAAMAATKTTPIVFTSGADPVQQGFVTSLGHPGGNATGVTMFTAQLITKRLQLLHELLPSAVSVAALINPSNPAAQSYAKELQTAADSLGVTLQILTAGSERELDAAFETLREHRTGALLLITDPFFESRREQHIALAVNHVIPTIYAWREDAVAGGLISYGTSIRDLYRQAGVYTGKILEGARPADLPVEQATKVELVINLKTAKALRLTVPQSLLARADEVIE